MEIAWKTRYDTGIQIIDQQHQELFQIVDRLRQMIQEGAERAMVENQLEKLLICTERHFATEETLMGQYNYPDLSSHVAEHASMLSSLRELLARFQESHQAMAMLVPTFMEGWLRHHISDGDFGFMTYLKARNIV